MRTVEYITWVVGIRDLPTFVREEGGEAYRPIGAFVLDDRGFLRAACMGAPGDEEQALEEALTQSQAQPMMGQPEIPDEVVVEDEEVEKKVSSLIPSTKVTVTEVPHFDNVIASMQEFFAESDGEGEDEETSTSYLEGDATPSDIAAFFDAAAELYDRSPWKRVPNDSSLIRLTCGAIGVKRWIACVVGQMGESYGILFFPSHSDYRRFHELASSPFMGPQPGQLPRHAALNYERGADVHPLARKEISTHGWRVAGAGGYPEVMLMEPDLLLRPPSAVDYRRLSVLALALSRFLDHEPDLGEAWLGGDQRRRRFSVPAGDELVTVTVSTVV